MPQIVKTLTAEGIYNNTAYSRFVDSGKYFGEYNALADNGEVYIIRGSSETKQWYAYLCVAPTVADKSNFAAMLRGYQPSGEVSEVFKTKKALTTAIEEGTAGFKPWTKAPYEFVRTGQVPADTPTAQTPIRPKATAKSGVREVAPDISSPADGLPKWTWYLAAVVVVAVAIALLNN